MEEEERGERTQKGEKRGERRVKCPTHVIHTGINMAEQLAKTEIGMEELTLIKQVGQMGEGGRKRERSAREEKEETRNFAC